MPKRGGLGQFADLRGGLAKEVDVLFLRGYVLGLGGKVGEWGILRNGGIILKWGRLIPFTDYVWSDSLTTQAIW